jgi:DNA-binding NtrC family response regulator
METYTVLLAENDSAIARPLAISLGAHFRSVRTVSSADELRSALPRVSADVIVADLETITLEEVADLHRKFHLPVVCTHRIPDEDIWTAAMEAGALDVCSRTDVGAIVRAITDMRYSHSNAA